MTDVDAKFSKQIGWTKGERTGRYAMVIDHGKVVYAEVEPAGDVTVSTLPTEGALIRKDSPFSGLWCRSSDGEAVKRPSPSRANHLFMKKRLYYQDRRP